MAKTAKRAKRKYTRRQNVVQEAATKTATFMSEAYKEFLLEQKRITEEKLKAINDEIAKLS